MGAAPDTPPDETLITLHQGQKVFGRFVLDEILGRGGMGVVWKAYDETLEKSVALKFILEAHAQNPDAVAGLKRETRRCQELRHPGIVAIYDLHQESRRVAVSMEYVEGATLASLKSERDRGCFDPEEVLPWLEQLGPALTYAHEEARVVHRDLKPSNLILASNSRLKVMDFGVSQPLSETISGGTGSWPGGVSPPYGSPQQLMGERATVSDDVYSLGATIYDLLTGRPPFFRGRIDLQVMESTAPSMTDRRTELGNSGAPIPQPWDDAIGTALSKSPDLRQPSIAALVTALREGIHGEAPAAPKIKIAVHRPEPGTATPSTTSTPTRAAPTTAPLPAYKTEPPVPQSTIAPAPFEHPMTRRRRSEGPNPLTTAAAVLAAAAVTAGTIHFLRHRTPAPTPAATAATPEPKRATPTRAPNALEAPARKTGVPPR